MMSPEEQEKWEVFKELHRSWMKAQLEIRLLRFQLKAVEIHGSLVPGWEERVNVMMNDEYGQWFLAHGEEALRQAEQWHLEELTNQLLDAMPPPKFVN